MGSSSFKDNSPDLTGGLHYILIMPSHRRFVIGPKNDFFLGFQLEKSLFLLFHELQHLTKNSISATDSRLSRWLTQKQKNCRL
ncbi:hypothetical protein RU97_GL000278 [Enterococcus canis]|uniref:Uncharacterized protein n=1 Tax=Enterococcus canis TaxID=214095 RepID=A0A1L8RK10_9ENTE|nr:hypothetical protein RU97_GL000278 [Enterococcus canis]